MILGQRGGLQCCLKTISWQAHISASYLAALFNTVVGVTYREYVKSVRLSCAAESMLRSNARILEVSSSLSYTEPSNFVRDFRSGFGVCPAKWRGSYSDDFLWPRREVGREPAKGDVPVANATPGTPGAAPGAPGTAPNAALGPPKPNAPKRPAQTNPFGNFFGNSPPPRQAPPPRAPGGVPRPPAPVGRSAAVQ